jgi:hypothetical protein
MTERELGTLISELVHRYIQARDGSAEQRMVLRQLGGLRRTSEVAGLIIEEHVMEAHLPLS